MVEMKTLKRGFVWRAVSKRLIRLLASVVVFLIFPVSIEFSVAAKLVFASEVVLGILVAPVEVARVPAGPSGSSGRPRGGRRPACCATGPASRRRVSAPTAARCSPPTGRILSGQLQGQGLEARRLGAVHHHALGRLVETGHQLLVDDHFGDDGVNGFLFQRKTSRSALPLRRKKRKI